jgi:FkbM family methyltransferase
MTVSLPLVEGFSPRCHPLTRPHLEAAVSDDELRQELAAFVEFCTPGMQFLDLGAHYGLFTLAALHFAGPGARAVCVEASPAAARVLRRNLALNDRESATVVNAAVSNHDGRLSMLTTGPAGADFFVPNVEPRPDAIAVSAMRVGTILASQSFTPTHVKVDIEGWEFEVIHDAKRLLQELHPFLFLELHGDLLRSRGKEPEAVVDALRDAGYRFLQDDRELDVAAFRRSNFNLRCACVPVSNSAERMRR